MSDKIELKPCPFCGADAVNSSHISCDCCGKSYTGIINCISCGAEVSHFDTDDEAIKAWNTRADTSSDAAVMARRWLEAKSVLATKDAEIARLTAENERMREAMRGKFCALFLDGRNEYGSHVIPLFPTSIDITPEDLGSDLSEQIIQSAESEGFAVGDMVWGEFEGVPSQVDGFGRVEAQGYWEFKRIDVDMTRAALSPIPDPAGGMPVEVK